MTRRLPAFLFAALAIACGASVPPPAEIALNQDACAYCRMIVSDRHFASQIASPLDEARFFDDLGCLARYLERSPLAAGTEIYVTDHRTLAWTPARTAIFTRVDAIAAPMGSHVIAHASETTRADDPAAAGGARTSLDEVLPALKGRPASEGSRR